MALFDLGPKSTPEALFGRTDELERLTRLIKAGRWTAVLGPRMVGKTSLVRAATKPLRRQVVYVNLWGATGTSGFVEAFAQGINSNRSLFRRVRGRLRDVEGLSIGAAGVSIAAPRRRLRTVWELMERIAEQDGDAVFVLDEFQEVSSASGQILKMLANLFNTHSKLEFVFTGSRFGVIRALLEPRTTSPLFGRSPEELDLKAFDEMTSVNFLSAGFEEYGLRFERTELQSVVARSLDGIPGWLAMYGSKVAVSKLSQAVAEEQTTEEGKKVAREELHHFLEGRSRENHWPALRALSTGANWTELRSAISTARGFTVNDATVRSILLALDGASLLVKTEGRYSLADPMVRKFVASSRRAP